MKKLWKIVILSVIAFSCACSKSDVPKPPRGYPNITLLKAAYLAKLLKPVDLNPVVPDSIMVMKDIVYKYIADDSLALDIYRKKDLDKPAPLLVFIHGGAWRTGKRQDYLVYLLDFAKRGYVTATVSYRLVKKAPFPAAVQDVKCAIKWLKLHSNQYQFDPNKIAVIGGSAGGHLSLMVGYSSDVPELESECETPGVDSRVNAVIDIYGPMDLTTEYAKNRFEVLDFMAGTFEEFPEKYKLASPLTHISADDPPTLIFHGTIDELVPVNQSDRLEKELQKVGVPVEYHRLKGWPHTMDVAKKVNEYMQYFMFEFLKEKVPFD